MAVASGGARGAVGPPVKPAQCGVLILKDTPATVERKRAAPGLLGTNVLARIPRFAEMMRAPSGGNNKSSKSKRTGFIRVSGITNLRGLSHSVVSVPVTGPACGSDALVEGLRMGVSGNLQVANLLVDATKTNFADQRP